MSATSYLAPTCNGRVFRKPAAALFGTPLQSSTLRDTATLFGLHVPRKTQGHCPRGLRTQRVVLSFLKEKQEDSTDRVAQPAPTGAEPPHHAEQLPDSPGSPARLLSDSIIVANIIIFVFQILNPNVTLFGAKVNELIDQGQVWRFVTAAFLHGSPAHLFVNMLSLHSLGPVTEWTCGRERFAVIYMVAAIMGNLASYLGDDNPSLGASGAIFGLAGALAVYFWRNRRLFGSRFDGLQRRLWFIIALNLGTGLVLPQIDEWGHLGGLVGGAAVAYLLGPKYELCLVKGRTGVWVIDEPPVETGITTPPRKVLP